jgi:hypothetical protein
MMKIVCKLGNMRKEQDWVIYPIDSNKPNLRTIQCDNRIARIDLETGNGYLSSPRNYPGFHTLSPQLGATLIKVSPEIINKLKNEQVPVDSVNVNDLI